MRKLALAMAAAALLTAVPLSVTTPASAAPLAARADTMTDVSSRHWRHYGWHHRHHGWYRGRHYGYRHYRPYYRHYGMYRRSWWGGY